MRFTNLADWLWGCGHRRTTLPITREAETYVVCLECGRRFEYDWATMRKASRWPFRRPSPDRPEDQNKQQSGRDMP